MAVDPLASIRIWGVDLELGGRVFKVPALAAADWFPILLGHDILQVMDMVADSADIDEMILAGDIEGEALVAGLRAVIEEVTGRPVHAAMLLAQLAQLRWELVGGELARAGFRWDQMPIGAALDAIRAIAMANIKDDSSAKKLQAILDSDVPVTTAGGRRRPNRSKALADHEAMAGPPPSTAPLAPVRATSGPSAGARSKTPLRPLLAHQADSSGEPM